MADGVLSLKGTLVGARGSGSGGHVIQNPSGSSVTQRPTMQFAGDYFTVTDDSVNEKTVIEVDVSRLNNLFVIRNETLAFTNNVATVTDVRITANSVINVYYTKATRGIAQDADIEVETGSGIITFTAANTPSGTIVVEAISVLNESALGAPNIDAEDVLYGSGTVKDALDALNAYVEQTVSLSASADVTATFTDARFTANSLIDIAVSEWGVVPKNVVVTTGSCDVTFGSVETAHNITCRVYMR